MRFVARSVLALFLGYVVLIILTTVVQETLLGGVSYRESTALKLAIAGILTPLAAVAAGCVTALIAGSKPLLHVVPMSLAIVVETTALYTTGRVDGPLWFEALAGGALVAGVILGAWLGGRRIKRAH